MMGTAVSQTHTATPPRFYFFDLLKSKAPWFFSLPLCVQGSCAHESLEQLHRRAIIENRTSKSFYMETFILSEICTFKSHILLSLWWSCSTRPQKPPGLFEWLQAYASKVDRKFVTISFNLASVWSEIFPSVLLKQSLVKLLTQK